IAYGGYSSEYEISIKSGEFIFEILNKNPEWNIFKVLISKEKTSVLLSSDKIEEINQEDFSFKFDNNKVKFDAIYNIIHGSPGETGEFSSLLEKIGIPHTSCSSKICKLTFDKHEYVKFINSFNLKTAKQFFIKKGEEYNVDNIIEKTGIPCFVKPNKSGSSFGISKVTNKDLLNEKIDYAFEEGDEVLIESFLDGKEVSVGVINIDGQRTILPITEIRSKNEFFDYDAKYNGESDEITPGELTTNELDDIHKMINTIYDNINLSGITRSEIILVGGIPHLLETNTIPGFTKQSIVPQQIKAAGLSINKIIESQIKSLL
ncbi:MAG: ATP-grasp domain-containing protein, partial [Pelagibacterales bacterium]|nr:ATP-grasp domain-containing protein [Pelagibacterales bacterium]